MSSGILRENVLECLASWNGRSTVSGKMEGYGQYFDKRHVVFAASFKRTAGIEKCLNKSSGINNQREILGKELWSIECGACARA